MPRTSRRLRSAAGAFGRTGVSGGAVGVDDGLAAGAGVAAPSRGLRLGTLRRGTRGFWGMVGVLSVGQFLWVGRPIYWRCLCMSA